MVDRARTLRLVGFGALVTAWGFNYLFVRYGLTYAAPLWLAFLRAATGAVGAFALTGALRRTARLDRRGQRDALLLGLLNTALFFGLWTVAAGSVLPGEVATLVYTFPIWVALLSAPILGHRLTGRTWMAIGGAFLGVALLSQPWNGAAIIVPWAVAALLVSAIAWALATVLMQRRFGPEVILEANSFQLLGGSLALLAGALLLEPGTPPVLNLPLLATVLWLGLIGTAFAYSVWFHLLARTHAATLSAYVFLVPIVALGASAILFSERLDLVQVAGVALVLIAVYLIGRDSSHAPPPRGATAPLEPPLAEPAA